MGLLKIRRIDLYPDDFLGGTVGLDDNEFALYVKACLLIYSTGGPIRVDHLRAVSKSHGRTFNRCLKTLKTLGKLFETEEKLSNKRCETELKRAHRRLENQKDREPSRGDARARLHYNNQHTTIYRPLRDPIEIAKEKGLRK